MHSNNGAHLSGGGQVQTGVTGPMDKPGGDACKAVRRTEQDIRAPIFPNADRGNHGSLAAPLEHGEVHCLPDGDPPVRPACHQFLRDPAKDRSETGRLGSGGTHDAGGGYSAHLGAIYLHQTGGGLTVAQG